MRITIQLDDQLLAAARGLAARSGRSVSAVIEEALREMLARRQQAAARPPVRLPTPSGAGLQSGVDLDDSAALLELMNGSDGPARR
ncbi:MAG: ribbon-helix-helix protein, CopG family [Dehalococcoidia bacterium]|nr:ribbon-helix-helix protein, CopG family [Dehalococcoidia bacterium]MSQ17030.1 ribbon-helix-helix protein, CopG family [Dehalococcoidia bacterium]